MRRFRVSKSEAEIGRCLRKVVITAAKMDPSYRRFLCSNGIKPDMIRSAESLSKLPITSKMTMLPGLARARRTSRRHRRRIVRSATSGTSGQVLLVGMSLPEWWFRAYSYFRCMTRHARLSWPLTIAHIGSVSLEPMAPRTSRSWVYPVRVVRVPRSLRPSEQVDQLLASRVQVVTGHPTCLEAVARDLASRGTAYKTRLIACRGEILSARTREALSRGFDGRIADYYNCEEIGNMAYECPADPTRMHVNTDACWLEVVDGHGVPQEIGVEGDVVVTNLYNLTMPFVRYALGDRATLLSHGGQPCACGSLAPTILAPAGRMDDYFVFPDGRRMSPRTVEGLVILPLLQHLRAESPDLLLSPKYQIVQESEESIVLLVDAPLSFAKELETEVVSAFRKRGFSVQLAIREVSEIPLAASGKSKNVRSLLDTGEPHGMA